MSYFIPTKGSMTLSPLFISGWEVPTNSTKIDPPQNLMILQYETTVGVDQWVGVLRTICPIYLWLAKLSSSSVHRVPAVANIMVVSRSAMIPLTSLAALIQAWVPRDPDCNAARTKATFSLTLRAWSWRSRLAYVSCGSPWTLPASCTSSTQLLPRSWTVVRMRFAIYR